MGEFLILKLQGPMQSWGEHSFEGLRPSANFPTRSGLLGLLGACLGISRCDRGRLQALADSVGMAVRVDSRQVSGPGGAYRALKMVKITDYHSVKDAREGHRRLGSHETIQTWREYLYDAEFTLALWCHDTSLLSVDDLEQAVKRPHYTPYLGRRSCPIARPLFYARLTADDVLAALKTVEPCGGTVYSEAKAEVRMKRIRDVPLIQQPRQFAGRNVYVHGGQDVPE